MATLKDKVRNLATFAWNDLRHATDQALKTNEFKDFETAFTLVRHCEVLLQAVRSQVRTHMRKTKAVMQEACPHPNKVDVRIHHNVETNERVVEEQACTSCGKHFDLRKRVS